MSKPTADQAMEALSMFVDAYEYSGRGMFGRECPAVNFEDQREAFTLFVELAQENPELAEYLASTASIDGMGRGLVVYWPGLKFPAAQTES